MYVRDRTWRAAVPVMRVSCRVEYRRKALVSPWRVIRMSCPLRTAGGLAPGFEALCRASHVPSTYMNFPQGETK